MKKLIFILLFIGLNSYALDRKKCEGLFTIATTNYYLEKICEFDDNVSEVLAVNFENTTCMKNLNKLDIERITDEVYKDSISEVLSIGKYKFCKDNRIKYDRLRVKISSNIAKQKEDTKDILYIVGAIWVLVFIFFVARFWDKYVSPDNLKDSDQDEENNDLEDAENKILVAKEHKKYDDKKYINAKKDYNNENLNIEEYTPEEQAHLDLARKQLEDEAKEKEDAIILQFIEEQQLQKDKIKAENKHRELMLKQEQEDENNLREKAEYISSISTLNPIKWARYTLIINKAEKKFVDIYNFQTPAEYKKLNLIMQLSITLLFEEARLERLSPKDFIELLVGLDGDGLAKYIKPEGNSLFDFEAFRKMYTIYIDFRAREFRPIVAMGASLSTLDDPMTKADMEKFSKEYEANPMFGRSV